LDDLRGKSTAAPKQAAVYRPYHWYQDSLWRLRLPFVLAILLPSALVGAAFAWLAFRIRARRIVLVLWLIVFAAAALYLMAGAWQLVQRGYSLRGVRWLAICAALGATAGVAWVTFRHRHPARRSSDHMTLEFAPSRNA